MLQGNFIKNFGIYFSGAMIVAFFNYLFYPVLGHIMSVSDFGELQAILALITQLSVVFGALSVVVVHIIARPGNIDDKGAIISGLRKIVFWAVSIGSLCIVIASVPLSHFLHFTDPTPFVGLALLLFATTLPLFRNAYLQGTNQFFYNSISSSILAIGRIIGAVVFVAIGWGVFGATVGVACAYIASWIYVLNLTLHAPALYKSEKLPTIREKSVLLKELQYGMLALVTNGSIAILYTADVLFVKHYFDSQTAGLYAAVSAVSNIGYFVLAPLATVLLPSVAGDTNARHRTLRTALLVYAAIAIPLLSIFLVFHTLIISVLFGTRFIELSYVLPIAASSTALVALATIINSYFLAMRRIETAVIIPAAVIALFGLCIVRHTTVEMIVANFLATSTLLVCALGFLYLMDRVSYRRTQ